MNNTLAKTGDFAGSTSGVALLVGGSLVTLFTLRVLLFPGMGGDEGEQLIFSQYFDWGYQVRNPPLFTWLVIAVSSVIGPSVYSVVIVKGVALAFTYFFLWQSATRILNDERLAALATASPLALYYVAWDVLYSYSHSVLVMMFYMATLWLVIRISEHRRTGDFVWLGLAIAGGLLSKYVFAFFLIALLGACTPDRILRKSLFRPPLLISFILALIILTPHLMWLADNIAGSTPILIPASRLKGLLDLVVAIAGFLSPLWLILALLFPAAVMKRPGAGLPDEPWARFLERYFLILVALAAFTIVFFPVDRLRTHYMFVLLPLIIYFFLKIKSIAAPLPRLRLLGAVIVFFAVLPLGGIIVDFVAEPLRCSRCQHHIPYAELANKLRKAGFTRGTIFAYWYPDPIAGNIRAQFGDSRVISAKHPRVQPPVSQQNGQCLLLWPLAKGNIGHGATIDMANRHLGTSFAKDTPFKTVEAPLIMGGGKRTVLGYILANPKKGSCH